MKKEEKTALVKLAKEALNSSDVCQDWKDKIYEAAPSLKSQLEVGKWYKYNGAILNYQKTREDGVIIAYGVTNDGTWYSNDMFGSYPNYWKLATHEEVEKALITEFERNNKPFEHYAYHRPSSLDDLNDTLYGWNNCEPAVKLYEMGEWFKIEPTVTIGGQECTAEFLQQKLDELKNK